MAMSRTLATSGPVPNSSASMPGAARASSMLRWWIGGSPEAMIVSIRPWACG
jgi:hypothetical protein